MVATPDLSWPARRDAAAAQGAGKLAAQAEVHNLRMSEAKRSHDLSWPARRDAAAAQGAGKLAAFMNKTPKEFRSEDRFTCRGCCTYRHRTNCEATFKHVLWCIHSNHPSLVTNVKFYPIWQAPEPILQLFINVDQDDAKERDRQTEHQDLKYLKKNLIKFQNFFLISFVGQNLLNAKD